MLSSPWPLPPSAPARFDPEKVLRSLRKCVAAAGYSRQRRVHREKRRGGDQSVVGTEHVTIGKANSPPTKALRKTVLVRDDVGGFTRHNSSGIAAARGALAGLAENPITAASGAAGRCSGLRL